MEIAEEYSFYKEIKEVKEVKEECNFKGMHFHSSRVASLISLISL